MTSRLEKSTIQVVRKEDEKTSIIMVIYIRRV
jgi:hypothetical protein